MVTAARKMELRAAWKALRDWVGPWDPINTGDSSALINGTTINVKVHRWLEPDGTRMAAAMAEGIELERKVVGSTDPN